jgi:hypothetical protein
MKIITIEQLLGPWRGEPWSPAELASGEHVCQAWNALGAAAESEGVILQVNPATGCHIGGSGNGGARPKGSKVGAPGSKHQLLLALDFFDPHRALMKWILSRGLEKVGALGMYFEHPQWTVHWVHGQIVPPASGHRFFVPYADLVKNPCTCVALAEQEAANLQIYEFKEAA